MADTEVEGSDLSAIIADEIRNAQTFDQTKRALAIEYMRGEMSDLPARVNGSSQTSRDVADTISWMLPGIVRVFTASDQMVQFEATQEGGEQGAEEASEYTNYSFFRENDGYRILYNGTYDSLLMGNGAACSYWCPEEAKTKLFRDKTAMELALLLEEGWQGLGQPPQPSGMDEETGQPTFTVRLKMVTERGQIRDMTLKPENLELSGNATTIEEARYRGYVHDELTRSDLLEMADDYGWDKSVIEEAQAYNNGATTNEATLARQATNTNFGTTTIPLKSGDDLRARECYLNADRDGDGIAEMLRVWCIGEGSVTILSEDEWEDDVPFTDIPCYPVPHRWDAEGVYDREADVQRVKTVLLRQALDNTYAVNMPMREVEEGSVLNPDILINPKFNGLIWKKKTSAPIIPHVIPYTADKSFAALEYMDTVTARRTGVSKTTMALDPEALQNQTATASQNQRDAGYSQIELVARNMAELGWTKFFAKRRNLAKKYIKEAVKIPSRNGDVQQGQEGQPTSTSKYRTIQPEQWSDDMACTINVGLGTGSRDRDMAMLDKIIMGQIGMADRLVALGLKPKAVEFIPKIRKAAVEMAEASGIKNPDDYYPTFTEDETKQAVALASQPLPDPAIALEQARAQTQMQLKQVDVQTAKETAQIQAQSDVVKNQAELQADLQTREADRQSALQELGAKQAFDMEKLNRDDAFRYAQLAQTRELELLKIDMAEQQQAENGPDGKPKKVVKPKADIHNETLMQGIGQLGEMLKAMHGAMNAPVEIVRGADGRATGTRKVMN